MKFTKAFKTQDEIIAELLEHFYKAPEKQRLDFMATPFENLITYHHSLGRDIRNTYGLWLREWTPVLEKGIDVSQFHPDAVSMKIIEELWVRLHQPH